MQSTPRARGTIAAVSFVMLCTIAATAAGAASVLDFDVWMRAIDKHSVDVQKNIEARKSEAAAADARELERLYGLMERYFVDDGHAPDAVTQSQSGKALAAGIPAALAAQDFDRAASAALSISHACNDCHDVHKPFQ